MAVFPRYTRFLRIVKNVNIKTANNEGRQYVQKKRNRFKLLQKCCNYMQLKCCNYMQFKKISYLTENGYGPNRNLDRPIILDVFAKFYDLEFFPLHDESSGSFNAEVYLKRIQTSIETFLLEANARYELLNELDSKKLIFYSFQ